MTDEAKSPLRRRMIEDMTIRKFAPKTHMTTCKGSRTSQRFSGDRRIRRPSRTGAATNSSGGKRRCGADYNQTVSTLRFFFRVTLKRHDIVEHTHVIHEPRKLPVVLSPEEVARPLDAAPGLKYKAALSVAYGAGLRATEVVCSRSPILTASE